MAKRKPISKRTRFEVLKRDLFRCQYCGRSAPDVTLHVDHIVSVKNDGSNDLINLVTSCADCNLGKSHLKLSDHSTVQKQRAAIEQTQEKLNQVRELAEWRNGLKSEIEEKTALLVNEINSFDQLSGSSLTNFATGEISKWLKKFTIEELIDATEKSRAQYYKSESDFDTFFDKIPRIAYWTKKQAADPALANRIQCLGFATKRWWRCDRAKLLALLGEYQECGATTEQLMGGVSAVKGIMDFEKLMDERLGLNDGSN